MYFVPTATSTMLASWRVQDPRAFAATASERAVLRVLSRVPGEWQGCSALAELSTCLFFVEERGVVRVLQMHALLWARGPPAPILVLALLFTMPSSSCLESHQSCPERTTKTPINKLLHAASRSRPNWGQTYLRGTGHSMVMLSPSPGLVTSLLTQCTAQPS